LIVDELVHNAETPVEDKHKMQIVIHARLKEPRPYGCGALTAAWLNGLSPCFLRSLDPVGGALFAVKIDEACG
jgi:hypothetical protein